MSIEISRLFKKALRRIIQIYVTLTLVAIATILLIAGTPFGKWLEDAQRVGCTSFENLQEADAVVVLGGDMGSRSISAEKVFRGGKAPKVIISADEDKILDALLAGGIPRERIFIDSKPTRTIDHPRTILEIPGITIDSRIIVTSSDLQERRAKYLFEKAGYKNLQIYSFERDFVRFMDEHPEKFPPKTWNFLRVYRISYAYLAWLKYFILD